jgi:hypothetical protein
MSTFLTKSFWGHWERDGFVKPGLSPAVTRTALLLGCAGSVAVAVVIATSLGGPQAYLTADPQLAVLMRSMAAIKSLFVIAAIGVLFWRFGYGIGRNRALIYLVSAGALTGSTAMIWELTAILVAAVIFHVSGFALLFAALSDYKRSGITIAKFRARL